jgi:hypothetical protein
MRVPRAYALKIACCAVIGATLWWTTSASAGGFQLGVEAPSKSTQAIDGPVLVVRTYGCYRPADAVLTAVAEGRINGERQSVKLSLVPTATGVYAIKRQWPTEGVWVLTISGDYNSMVCSVLVELGADGSVKPGTRLEAGSSSGSHSRSVCRKWTSAEVNAAIDGIPPAVARDDSPGSAGYAWPAAGAGAVLSLAGLFAIRRRWFRTGGHA